MYRFPCAQCGLTFIAPERPGQDAVCPNCNSRQPVPSYAVPLTPEEERHLEHSAGEAVPGGSSRMSVSIPGPVRREWSSIHKSVLDAIALGVGWIIIACGLWSMYYVYRASNRPYSQEWDTSRMMMPLLSGTMVISWGLALLYLRHVLRRGRR